MLLSTTCCLQMICYCLEKLLSQKLLVLSPAWINIVVGLVSPSMPLSLPSSSARTPILPPLQPSEPVFPLMIIPKILFILVCQSFWRTLRGEGFKASLIAELMVGGKKTLSQASRLVLLKSVAAAIPAYAMGTFFIPNSYCKELDRSFKNFWWSFPSKKTRNLSLKAWDSICSPKALGGLGIRKIRDVNLALISKLGWQLLNNSNSLWVSQMQGKYLNSSSFLSPSPLSSFSWLWKGILKTQSFISK